MIIIMKIRIRFLTNCHGPVLLGYFFWRRKSLSFQRTLLHSLLVFFSKLEKSYFLTKLENGIFILWKKKKWNKKILLRKQIWQIKSNPRASSRGLVVKADPHYGDHFSGTIHLDQSLEQKLWKNSNLALLHML